jgi:hypothetical protein
MERTTSRMGRFALLAAMMAAAAQGGADIYSINPQYRGMIPGITIRGDEESFGTYRASSRTLKRYLRQHHLGKFKKGRR